MLISIICPIYNESCVIENFLNTLIPILEEINENYEVIFVNDGSSDDSLNLLCQFKRQNPHLRILNLSRNFGKENALSAGLDAAKGDVAIPIDADLQDPPVLIKELYAKYLEGYDIVLARRIDRTSDGVLKRKSAEYFYKMIGKISHLEIPHNVGDFRLISKKALDVLKTMPETQRFMRGIFSWLGFRTAYVNYSRDKRVDGVSKYGLWKLLDFAIEGVTSFSIAPLRMWTYIGILVSIISFTYGSFIIIKTLTFGIDLPGYASLLTIILFLGGIQLIGIGVLGEYIGKIYMETKRRPTYIIDTEL